MCRAAIAAVPGAIAAVAVAYLTSGRFPVDFVRRIEPHPGNHFDLLVLGLGPLVLALALVLWTLGSVVARVRRTEGGPRPATITEKQSRSATPSSIASISSRSAPEQMASGVVRQSPRTNSSTPGRAWKRRS